MAFDLPPLPYDFSALEPHIDAQTMEIHHDRHHQAYINNLTAAIAKHPELSDKTVEELLSDLNAIPDVKTIQRKCHRPPRPWFRPRRLPSEQLPIIRTKRTA